MIIIWKRIKSSSIFFRTDAIKDMSIGVGKMTYKTFEIGSDYGGSYSFTADKKGVCIFSIYADAGYFVTTLTQNSNEIAKSYTKGGGFGYDTCVSRQYGHGWAIKQFTINKGDIINFNIGQNNDSGNGTVYLVYYII